MTFIPKEDAKPTRYADSMAKLKENQNKIITKPIPRLDNEVGKKRKTGGKVKKFTPTRMRNQVNKFFKQCEERDEMPTIKGLMIFLKLHVDMFYKYIAYPEFKDIMEHTRMIISHWVEMDVYNTQGRTEGKIAYMKNIHAWTDKIETKNETVTVQLTADAARARIEALAPKLLEVLKSTNTVNQIAKEVIDVEVEPPNPRRLT